MSWAKWTGANDRPDADDFLRLVEQENAYHVVRQAECAIEPAITAGCLAGMCELCPGRSNTGRTCTHGCHAASDAEGQGH